MSRKANFVTQLVVATTKLAQVVDDFENLADVYVDRGYNGAGANPIVAEDLEHQELDLATFGNAVAMAGQLLNFANGSDVTTADYSVAMNKLRTDI